MIKTILYFIIFIGVIFGCNLNKKGKGELIWVDIYGTRYKFEEKGNFYYHSDCDLVKIDTLFNELKGDSIPIELYDYYSKFIYSPTHYGDPNSAVISFIINPSGKIEKISILQDVKNNCFEDKWRINIDSSFILNNRQHITTEYIITVVDICYCLCQKDIIDKTQSQIDSTNYLNVNRKLHGCWKSGDYQFKYDSTNKTGTEFNSKIHSSAPLFELTLRNMQVYLNWLELTGGNYFQKIIWINDKKIKLKNEDDSFSFYTKNKCQTR